METTLTVQPLEEVNHGRHGFNGHKYTSALAADVAKYPSDP
jgi:hypothetical protein